MSETAGHDFGHLPPAAAGLGHIFARPKVLAAICVIVLAGLGWLYLALVLAAKSGSLGGATAAFMRAVCQATPDAPWSAASVGVVASMWGAMTLAMMLPSAAPMIMTYAGIADTAACKNERIVSPFVLAAGYMAVWFGFSIIATLVQIIFTQAALIDTSMTLISEPFAGAIFIGAGLYQFSALKHACLNHCQQPFPFFFANWATTPRGVFRLGLRQGLYCLGCCWAMMLVMFAVGAMNVIWMTGLGMIMTIEKLLTGRRFTRIIGVVLIIVGSSMVVAAFTTQWPTRTS